MNKKTWKVKVFETNYKYNLKDFGELFNKIRKKEVLTQHYKYSIDENTREEREQWKYRNFSVYIYGFYNEIVAMKNNFNNIESAEKLVKMMGIEKYEIND